MEKRRLGRTELMVTAISFGALPIQRCSMEEAGPVLKAALDKGINFFDTARAYTDSEEKIGRHIAKDRGRYYLASKSLSRDKQGLKQDLDTSLSNMKTDYLDLYQIHNIKNTEELNSVLAPGGALEGLLEEQQKGRVRFIGVTGHNYGALAEAVSGGRFDTVQAPYNIVEQQAAESLFPLARRLDMGLIAMKPLGGGQLEQIQSALRFVLEQEALVAIPGMDRLEHLEENLIVAEQPRPLSTQERAALEEEARIAGKSFCRRCGYCLPCPVGLNIPQIFIFRLQYNRYGMTGSTPGRYAQLPVKASACIKCGICENRCPYNLPVREWMAEMAEKLDK